MSLTVNGIDLGSLTAGMFTQQFIINHRTAVEGGYVDNAADLGGATNFGITQTTAQLYKSLWAKYNWDGNMKTMPQALAYDIYVQGWWAPLLLDQVSAIHPVLSDRLFDWGINSGRTRGVLALQRILNVCNRQGADYPDITVDGAMGPGTINALKAFMAARGKPGLRYLITTHSGMQNSYYVDISEQRAANETFTNGWLLRGYNNESMYAALIMNGTL